MDQGETPNSFVPSGDSSAGSLHRFVPNVEPGLLHALTGSILFHATAVLVMAVLLTEPPSVDRHEAQFVFSLADASQDVGELTLVVSDDTSSPDSAASLLDTQPLDHLGVTQPDFPVEFDVPAIATGDSNLTSLNTAIASSWAVEEEEEDGGSQGELGTEIGTGVGGSAEENETVVENGPGVKFFDVQGRGSRFVYVVDCSRSMFGDKWNRVLKELIRSLDELTPEQSFYIILFDGESHPMFGPSDLVKEMLPATSDNIAKARRWVTGYQLGAYTSPLSSIHRAMKLQPHAVFLLTDGEFADSTAQWLRDHNRETRIGEKPRVRVPVHTIGIFNKKTQRLLKRIARENNGQFQFVPETRP